MPKLVETKTIPSKQKPLDSEEDSQEVLKTNEKANCYQCCSNSINKNICKCRRYSCGHRRYSCDRRYNCRHRRYSCEYHKYNCRHRRYSCDRRYNCEYNRYNCKCYGFNCFNAIDKNKL